ncbi:MULTISPECIES: hypothetical protein [unclassified Nocardia]|nr:MULTISPECIES: hypothetical protein [unclassified Nocardia]
MNFIDLSLSWMFGLIGQIAAPGATGSFDPGAPGSVDLCRIGKSCLP